MRLSLKLMEQPIAPMKKLHMTQTAQEFLRAQGYRIFRVTNIDVYENLDEVCEALIAFVVARPD